MSHDPTPVEFSAFNLDPRLLQGVADRGYRLTTPIQSAVFPTVFEGRDLIACAETGTGKTAAFLLPILQRLLGTPAPAGTRVLVLAPTRELAVQIDDDFQGLGYHTGLSSVAVYGGVGAGAQDRALRGAVDLVVATPGRLLDHLNSGAARFDAIEVLVLDEADRMLDMGFWPSVRRIVSTLPGDRQTLLFSATMSEEVLGAAAQIMRAPQMIRTGRTEGLAPAITHVGQVVTSGDKTAWLAGFLRRTPGPSLVFVRTKRFADRLARRLAAAGVRCAALHADLSQTQRMSAVEGFRAGRHRALVATDIAARGLDIEGIEQVINYEVPIDPDAYVHRVGRTGRAAAAGTAITLVGPDEGDALRSLETSLTLRFVGVPDADLQAEPEPGTPSRRRRETRETPVTGV